MHLFAPTVKDTANDALVKGPWNAVTQAITALDAESAEVPGKIKALL